MNFDTNKVVEKLAENIKNLTMENANLQVMVEALGQERLNLLNQINELEREVEGNEEDVEY
ncbi:hypothetical protein IV487_01685 [Enterococcus saccharolyticus]|uniref:hypothetical protein n=1 Tax=Enterococcus saccharolyticus TaxID=41997 RepID=UPI001E5A9DA2|nr:hypothetical protein [Enterococcus saccharolyticus]MCD5001174.1 hypothetical protein [Enterococcus saccharolyticus]